MTGLAKLQVLPGDAALLVGRLCLASLFLWSGAEKGFDPAGAAGFAAAHGVPAAHLLMPLAAAFELAAGALLVIGVWTRPAAVALGIWIAVLGPWFHPFWRASPAMWQFMIDDFFHHIVMLGGMIYLAVCGPGIYRIGLRRHGAGLAG